MYLSSVEHWCQNYEEGKGGPRCHNSSFDPSAVPARSLVSEARQGGGLESPATIIPRGRRHRVGGSLAELREMKSLGGSIEDSEEGSKLGHGSVTRRYYMRGGSSRRIKWRVGYGSQVLTATCSGMHAKRFALSQIGGLVSSEASRLVFNWKRLISAPNRSNYGTHPCSSSLVIAEKVDLPN